MATQTKQQIVLAAYKAIKDLKLSSALKSSQFQTIKALEKLGANIGQEQIAKLEARGQIVWPKS